MEGFYAAHPERLSARAVAADADGGGNGDSRKQKQFRLLSGYDAVAQWLRDGLDPDRTDVRLSTIAETLVWKSGGVTRTCRGGDGTPRAPLRARAAVVTLPHAVLKAGGLRFDPPIAAKQRALAGLETGNVCKIVLRFRHVFWEDEGFLEAGRPLTFLHAHGADFPTWWSAAPVRAPLLTAWVGGKRAEALLAETPAVRLRRTLAALASLLGMPSRRLEELLDGWATHDWRADPFSRGAYSYIGVGGADAPRALARPVGGTLFFAGEATNGEQLATVAGALGSGRRAAREVIRALAR